jgi:hypothetical protein
MNYKLLMSLACGIVIAFRKTLTTIDGALDLEAQLKTEEKDLILLDSVDHLATSKQTAVHH